MSRSAIQLKNISFALPHRVCFQSVNAQIMPGDRIGIIGRNGSGKSSLLNMISGIREPSEGHIIIPSPLKIMYVPQIIVDKNTLSGGQRFYHAFTEALAISPDVLLLDEPTNHLDRSLRDALFQVLTHFKGTLIMASHDTALRSLII